MADERMTRDELVRRYEAGPDELDAAVEGLSEADLDYQPKDGGWSPREVVHHTADSEMTSAIRLRQLLAEANAQIQGYDEMEFSRRLHYRERPIAASLSAVRAARETSASILARLSDDDWNRSGVHAESGAYSVTTWLEIYAAHCHDHAEQISRAVNESRGVEVRK
jgi:DinB family protein